MNPEQLDGLVARHLRKLAFDYDVGIDSNWALFGFYESFRRYGLEIKIVKTKEQSGIFYVKVPKGFRFGGNKSAPETVTYGIMFDNVLSGEHYELNDDSPNLLRRVIEKTCRGLADALSDFNDEYEVFLADSLKYVKGFLNDFLFEYFRDHKESGLTSSSGLVILSLNSTLVSEALSDIPSQDTTDTLLKQSEKEKIFTKKFLEQYTKALAKKKKYNFTVNSMSLDRVIEEEIEASKPRAAQLPGSQ